MWRLIVIFLIALLGFWVGWDRPRQTKKECLIENIHPEKEFSVTEHKSFTLVIYAHNQSLWCERALSSVFEQDYDHYRVVFIDDGSTDGTSEKANQFIIDNNQGAKVILIRNETRLGPIASLYRVMDSCLDREIVLPLDAKDWLTHPNVLNRLNTVYQNPDVWLALASSLEYPTYSLKKEAQNTFYAALFKQIRLQDLYKEGYFATSTDAYLIPLLDLAGGRIRHMPEPLAFTNLASPIKPEQPLREIASYRPLAQFPISSSKEEKPDILVFSNDRPLQLYACLESIQRYFTGFENLTVLYHASAPPFEASYQLVQDAFPLVHFVAQSNEDPKHGFKPNVLKIIFDSPSPYILFGFDDIIIKDFVDLKVCVEKMQKTGAYGFYLRLGRHIHHCDQSGLPQLLPPSLPLSSNIYAWDFQTGEGDWAFPNNLDMTLLKKDQIKEAFQSLKYKTPDSLQLSWATEFKPEKGIGLYFERSKFVNITDNLGTEELLAKFNQGLKIDIEPLYKIENAAPHLDYIPEFVLR